MDPEPEPLFLLISAFPLLLTINAVALIVLLISSAMVSGTEVAFFSLSQTDLDILSEKTKKTKCCSEVIGKTKKIISYYFNHQ